MTMNRKIRVAITHGDTNGIGYELIFKTFENPTMLDLCTPIIYGSPKVATYHRNLLDIPANFTIVHHADDIKDGRINLVPVFDEEIKVELGVPTEESGNAGLIAINKALDDYRAGVFDVLVTAPIENSEAFRFSGQSRYIEDHLGLEEKGLSILVNEQMRIALATRNLPLKQVAESLTIEDLIEKTTIFHTSLKRDFRISNPRIALLALNPKAGENGLLGSEELEIINPAVNALADQGIQAFGAYPSDEFFGNGYWNEFDGVVAMYYDQAMIPFRALTTDSGVNYLGGLKLVRTSPEGTIDISLAGRNFADAAPMRHAIYTAIDIYRHRKTYDEPLKNPLEKLYKERRDDSEKVRFSVSKQKDDVPNKAE